MKTSLDHLPPRKQREIERVRDILLEELAETLRTATGPRKRQRIYKIVLFGSYARGGWVDEKTGKGYQSDYDILVLVSHKELTDMGRYWRAAEDRLLHDPAIKTPVQIIVHTLDEVNGLLRQGQYFFRDIKTDGIALYEFTGTKSSGNRHHALADPAVLTPQEAYDTAKEHFDTAFSYAQGFITLFNTSMNEKLYNHAAFLLHQATEHAYRSLLLTLTLYSPASHDLVKLRSLAESLDRDLVEAWPRGRRPYDRYFQLLRRAYTEARYSKHYEITKEALDWLGDRVERLHTLVETACKKRLTDLEKVANRP